MYEKIARIQDSIGKMKKATKAYSYYYVDLNQILEKLTPLLRKENLVLTQPIADGCIRTLLTDPETGQQMYSEIALPENVKPQDLGSAITYYRRYMLVSMFALESEDDDGAKVSGNKPALGKATYPKSKTQQANEIDFG